MINGQALGDTAKLRYGIFPVSFNGCEVISVCNAAEYLGHPVPLTEALRYMRRYCVLLGFFGCNVFRIGKALEHFGIKYKRTDHTEGKAFIISSWTGKPFLSTIHTVFCVREKGRITVYNRFNRCPHERIYEKSEDIFKGCKILAIYEIIGS